jgi:hypothetical protein
MDVNKWTADGEIEPSQDSEHTPLAPTTAEERKSHSMRYILFSVSAVVLATALAVVLWIFLAPSSVEQRRILVTVSSGAEVAVLLTGPRGFSHGTARYPLLMEMVPYRHDDLFYTVNFLLLFLFHFACSPSSGVNKGPLPNLELFREPSLRVCCG